MKTATYKCDDVNALIGTRVAPVYRDLLFNLVNSPQVASRLAKAPASGKVRFHHAYDGGLVDHILEVNAYATEMARCSLSTLVTESDIAIVAILHDLHKIGDVFGADYYISNILKKGDRSEAEPFKHNDQVYVKRASVLPPCPITPGQRAVAYFCDRAKDSLSGGDLSLELVYALAPELYAKLTLDHKFAIRFHDGAYATSKFDSEFSGHETPLQIIMHAADMLSARSANFVDRVPGKSLETKAL